MSNRLKIKQKRAKIRNQPNNQPPKYYTSFNIFTKTGKNITCTTPKPMTVLEAQFYLNALSISGND